MKLSTSNLAASADFLVAYIEEAHPLEMNHFPKNIEVEEHKSMQDRLAAAKLLVDVSGVEEFPCPIVVDKMDNSASHAYGALPERLFIIRNDKVAYKGGEGPYFYDIDEMEKKLREIIGDE